jgi:outer membrane protein assembly factor BamB
VTIKAFRTALLCVAAVPLTARAQADWPRFGFDAAGTNSSTAPAGIAAADLGKLRAQRITLPGTVDASAIYLHGVTVRGAAHDVFFVTTSYGITVAIDADSGTILWQHVPKGYDSWAGTSQMTTSTPVADPGRAFIYAANPGGTVEKLAVTDGSAAWSTSITQLPRREKIASALNFVRGRVIATTGGYIGDASPYQGHVALIDAASGRLVDCL